MLEHLEKYARNNEELVRIRNLIAYLNNTKKPKITIYKNIVLVNNKFTIVNESVARELLKHFSGGAIEYTDKKVWLSTVIRYGMKKNEFFEEVKNKFVSSDIKVDKIRLDELNKHSLYKWKVLLNVFGFSNEKYTLGNNKVYLTIVSLMDFEEGHMKFFDEFLRRYFFIENYEILEFKTEKCEEGVTAFTRLVIDPSNERVLIVM